MRRGWLIVSLTSLLSAAAFAQPASTSTASGPEATGVVGGGEASTDPAPVGSAPKGTPEASPAATPTPAVVPAPAAVPAPRPAPVSPVPAARPAEVEPPPPPSPRPRRTRRPRRGRPRAEAAPAPPAAVVSPDAGVVGPDAQIPDDAGTAASISSSASRLLPSRDLSALWWVLALVLVFASTRIGSRVVKARAAEGSRVGSVASRLWPLLETGVWILASLAAVGFAFGVQKHLLLYTLLACVAVAGAVQFNALRDVAAGLIFAAERPFDVGDVVRVAGIEGQVRGLRLRFLELDTSDGRRVQIPYREVVGTTDVRSGGARVANAVRLDLDLPATVDPTRALDAARELAASSPWAVLAAPPRVQLESRGEGRNVIAVEGYAFDAEVQSALHADLLSGWRDVLRGLSEG